MSDVSLGTRPRYSLVADEDDREISGQTGMGPIAALTTSPRAVLDQHQYNVTGGGIDRSLPAVPLCCGGRGSSAVERATPGEEVPGSIPAVAARSLQAGSVSV